MSTLKSGLKERAAALTICAAVAAGTFGFAAFNNGNTSDLTSDESVQTTTTASQQTVTVTRTMWRPNAMEVPAATSVQTQTATKAATTTSATTTTKAATTTTKAAATTTKAVTTTKTTTTKAAAVTTKKSAATTAANVNVKPSVYDVGGSVKDRLNSVTADQLKPKITVKGNEKGVLEKYMKMIIKEDMTNYEKVLTCYDYLINHTYYANGGWNNPIQSVLVKGFGTCTEYSHTMCAMLRYMGFNANCVWGQTAMARGGYGQHMWVELYIGGKTYVVDPQVDDNMSYGGNISHKRFVKLYSETPGNYIRGYVEKW